MSWAEMLLDVEKEREKDYKGGRRRVLVDFLGVAFGLLRRGMTSKLP